VRFPGQAGLDLSVKVREAHGTADLACEIFSRLHDVSRIGIKMLQAGKNKI
jgi:hypothetical protein